VTIANTTMNTTPPGNANIAGGGITISPVGGAEVDATITGSQIQNARNNAIRVDTDDADADATISGNTIGTAGATGSGSLSANGLQLVANGTGRLDTLVSGNTIRQYTSSHGIVAQQSEGTPTLNATITGNTLTEPNAGAGGVLARAGVIAGDGGVMCLDIAGNNLGAAGSTDAAGSAFNDIRLEQGGTASMRFPGLGATSLTTYLQSRNTGSPSVSTTSTSAPATAFQSTTNPCPQPDL
jgi:hypothetical protein